MPVTSSNPTRYFFFLPIFSPSFHDFHEMKRVSIILLCIFDEFYAPLFSHNTCTLSIYKNNMAKTSAESYVSLKGNDKAISILEEMLQACDGH